MALFECPRCKRRLLYADQTHHCSGKSSDGGVESRHAAEMAPGSSPVSRKRPIVPREKKPPESASGLVLGKAGVAPGPSETNCVGGAEVARRSHKPKVEGSNPSPATKSKRGRPKKGEVRAKPWEAEGISKASYYRHKRRQAEKRSK